MNTAQNTTPPSSPPQQPARHFVRFAGLVVILAAASRVFAPAAPLSAADEATAADEAGAKTDIAGPTPDAPIKWFYNVDDSGLAIGGYDVVSYFESEKPIIGQPEFTKTHDGVRYQFATATNAQTFAADPEQYVPAFGGWCAMVMGRTMENSGGPPARYPADPTNYVIHDGRLYLFVKASNVDAKAVWQADAEERIRQATAFWNTRLELGRQHPVKPPGLNRLARMETLQFDFLIGDWESHYTVRVSPENQATATVHGQWHAWYGWDGFAVYDDWKQVGTLSGNSGPAIRSYDPFNDHWVMHYIPINAPLESVWPMIASAEETGEIHGEMAVTDGQSRRFLQRIHFVDIAEDSFTWSSDRSWDEGKTWIRDWGVGKNTRVKSQD